MDELWSTALGHHWRREAEDGARDWTGVTPVFNGNKLSVGADSRRAGVGLPFLVLLAVPLAIEGVSTVLVKD